MDIPIIIDNVIVIVDVVVIKVFVVDITFFPLPAFRSKTKVFYVDFGNTQTLSLVSAIFYRLDSRFLLPFFAIPCQPANVEPENGRKWTDQSKEWFRQRVCLPCFCWSVVVLVTFLLLLSLLLFLLL